VTRGNCTARVDVGSQCQADATCKEHLRCNSTQLVCELAPPKLTAGSFCVTDTDCESGSCQSGICVEYCIGNH